MQFLVYYFFCYMIFLSVIPITNANENFSNYKLFIVPSIGPETKAILKVQSWECDYQQACD